MKKGDENMLKVPDVADRLGVLLSTVRIWCRNGRFPNAVQEETLRGPVWLIPESDLNGFQKRSRGRPPKAKPAQPNATSEKYGTLETQTRTTRRLNRSIKQSADEVMSSRKKGGKK